MGTPYNNMRHVELLWGPLEIHGSRHDIPFAPSSTQACIQAANQTADDKQQISRQQMCLKPFLFFRF